MKETGEYTMMDVDRTSAADSVIPAFQGAVDLATPRVVVDTVRLRRNIDAMRSLLPDSVALHPHVKTHKSFAIAGFQKTAGAAGFTTSRPPEAAAFLRAGFGPVTVAFPLVSATEAAALIGIARGQGTTIRFIADSNAGVDVLEAAAASMKEVVAVFIKVDVGLHRCGVDSHGDAALDVSRRIARAPHLTLAGLLSHAGHAYAAGDAERIRIIASQERDLLLALRDRLSLNGIEAGRISVGSTPTTLAHAGFDGIDEVRPGNYVFLDLAAVRLGLAERQDLSLAVVASVVSANDDHAIIDAGSKTLSSDTGPHGSRIGKGYGEAFPIGSEGSPLPVVQLSEEHGFVKLDGRRLAIGSKLLILPNHSCTVANLASEICFLEGGRPSFRPVDARSGAPLRT